MPLLVLPRGRLAYAAFVASTLAFQGTFVAFFVGGATAWGPFSLSGARIGVLAGLRLAAAVGGNVTVLALAGPLRILDGLRLPAREAAFLGAVVLAARDIGREAVLLLDAMRVDGGMPRHLPRKVAAVGSLLPHLVLLAVAAGTRRVEALRLAGHAVGPRFAPLVAVTALAAAGRLAVAVVPNVSLTYVLGFGAGLVFGTRVGAGGVMLAMALTNVLLTGLSPFPFVNVPAMGLVALLGSGCRRIDLAGWSGSAVAASLGVFATVVFSLASDTLEWNLVRELQSVPLEARLLAGLAFNVPAAVANAVLFAAASSPLSRLRRAGTAIP
jgi:hypothetical protein